MRTLPVTEKLRRLTNRQHAVLTGRAATGIWAALRAWGLKDQHILIPANTCYIVLWAILKSGNRPVLVDIEAGSYQLSAVSYQQVAARYKPAAIIPCHLYGLPAPIEGLCAWARENNIYMIEDAALALGSIVDDKPAGAWGDVSVFSFGQGKIVDNGLGGAALTDDPALAREIERLLAEVPVCDDHMLDLMNQWQGLYWSLHQYESRNPSLLSLYPKLFEIYGDITAYQLTDNDWDELPHLLDTLPANLEQRARLANMYDSLLSDDKNCRTITRPANSTLWKYPLLIEPEQRDDLLQHLWDNGIHDATRWYPSLRYMTGALIPEGTQPPTPNADHFADSIINLPLDARVDEQSVKRVCTLIQGYFRLIR